MTATVTPAFFLGTHQPGWLDWSDIPLFISDRRLRGTVAGGGAK